MPQAARQARREAGKEGMRASGNKKKVYSVYPIRLLRSSVTAGVREPPGGDMGSNLYGLLPKA